MKKLLLLLSVVFVISCTAEPMEDNEPQQTDPTKVCPSTDRNCDGCPDDQEPCE